MSKIAKRVLDIIGVITGVITFIYGIIKANSYTSMRYVTTSKYGGDAYTGIQNASATTANNIKALGELLQDYFGFLFIILGILIILHFLKALFETFSEDKNTKQIVSDNVQAELKKLIEIKEKGIITEEEFEIEKVKILK